MGIEVAFDIGVVVAESAIDIVGAFDMGRSDAAEDATADAVVDNLPPSWSSYFSF